MILPCEGPCMTIGHRAHCVQVYCYLDDPFNVVIRHLPVYTIWGKVARFIVRSMPLDGVFSTDFVQTNSCGFRTDFVQHEH